MIGVWVQSAEREIAREFFELFKTPWEFYRSQQRYEVLICTQDLEQPDPARLVLHYQSDRTGLDEKVNSWPAGNTLSFNGQGLPLAGKSATFPASSFSLLKQEVSQEPMALKCSSDEGITLRIGYDLFQEVRGLLTVGQSESHAQAPALELHIALLRTLITGAGIPVVEIPPAPYGNDFMVCLTHDVDHPVLRNHCCDPTMVGFLARATIGTLLQVCSGRKPLTTLWRNWSAAARLPFIYLGLAKDPWRQFDRYLEIEAGLGSTYFVIPKRDDPGRLTQGDAPRKRAASYSLNDIRPELEKITAAGGEVSLHGLDAWLDGTIAVQEREALQRVIGRAEVGVRMHWLYFEEKSNARLDQAGFPYDSTFGYTKTVGFRAGTAQAYRPVGAANLLELPLHIMDTALFYPAYLNLTESEAEKRVWQIISEVQQWGGALTINWHDRSIAPERLWDGFYYKLLAELKSRGAWFPTASQAVAWFKKRRLARLESVEVDGGMIRVRARLDKSDTLPGLRLRVHKPLPGGWERAEPAEHGFVDLPLDETLEIAI